MTALAAPGMTNRERLVLTVLVLNEQAKEYSRRGSVGYLKPAYAELHARIDVLVETINAEQKTAA